MGDAGGINLYAYVVGNPTNAIDPLGLVDISFTANYTKRDREKLKWEKTVNSPTVVIVAGEGPKGVGLTRPDGTEVLPDDLAKLIVALKKYDPKKPTPILLIVCYSGLGDANSYAQKVADAISALTHAPSLVMAPNVPYGPNDITLMGPPHLGGDPFVPRPWAVLPFVGTP